VRGLLPVPGNVGEHRGLRNLRASGFYADEQGVTGDAVPGDDLFIVMFENVDVEIPPEQAVEIIKTQCHHGVLILPGFGNLQGGFGDTQFQ